jgi:hypothetical protein
MTHLRGKWWISPDETEAAADCEEYTTDPAAAMLVLEKCNERLGGTAVCIATLGDNFFVWTGSLSQTKGETLPLAICLFAQKLFTTNK